MAKNKKITAFTSMRVLGKKAQQILGRKISEKVEPMKAIAPKRKEPQQMIMHLSLQSVVQVALTILAIVVGAWLIFHLRQKIFLMLLAAFVATVIDPGVTRMERWGLPRAIGILIHYLIAIVLLLFLVLSLIPIIAVQLQDIAVAISNDLGPFLADLNVQLPFIPADSPINAEFSRLMATTLQNISLDQFTTELQQTGQNLSNVATESVRFAAGIAGSVLNFLISFIIVLVLAFFMQMEKERIIRWFRSFLP